MTARVETTISIEETLLNQAEIVAERLNISRSQLFEMAIETFIGKHQQPSDTKTAREVNQGDIFWVKLDDLHESIPHPHVVVQANVLNRSRIQTVVTCALTTNIRRANLPGNILLDSGEANLPKQSVVEASKVSTVDKTQLGEFIGSLSERRIHQILDGMRFLQTSFFPQ